MSVFTVVFKIVPEFSLVSLSVSLSTDNWLKTRKYSREVFKKLNVYKAYISFFLQVPFFNKRKGHRQIINLIFRSLLRRT